MTGSASTGNGGRYHYYHCQRKYGCHNSFPASVANHAFEIYLGQFIVNEEVLKLYYLMLQDTYNTDDVEREKEKTKLEKEINTVKERTKNLDDMLLDGTLAIDKYNRLVKSMDEQENALILKHVTLNKSQTDFKNYINNGITLLGNLTRYYKSASATTKQKIVGSIFPENLVFDGKDYQTDRLNEVFALICSIDKVLRKNKPGNFAGQSTWAPAAGLEPATL